MSFREIYVPRRSFAYSTWHLSLNLDHQPKKKRLYRQFIDFMEMQTINMGLSTVYCYEDNWRSEKLRLFIRDRQTIELLVVKPIGTR